MNTACMKDPTYESLFDTKSGYWQMPIVNTRNAEKDRWLARCACFGANTFKLKLRVNLLL